MPGQIDHEIQGSVLVITINRPHKRNGFTWTMLELSV
jgi:enoyl-CoA hydratase/carnithine racemase